MSKEIDSCKIEVSEESIDLSNGLVCVSFDIRLGQITLTSVQKNEPFFSRSYIQVHTDREVYDSRKMTYKAFSSLDFEDERGIGKALVIKLADSEKSCEINVRLAVAKRYRGYWCAVQFRNKSDDCTLASIDPFVIDVDNSSRIFLGRNGDSLRFFRNGFQSWDLSCAKEIDQGENISHLFTVLTNRNSNQSLVTGFISAKDQFSTVSIYGRTVKEERLAQIVASALTDGVLVSRDESLISEELVLLVDENPADGVKTYLNLLGLRMNACFWENVPAGWCSWYFYYTMPDEGEILSNADFVRERFGNRVEWIQLDDGFQKTVGDWQVNSRFTSGLKTLAKKIHEKGCKAGIWTAPFVATEHSNIFKDHPDWFVRDENNNPIQVDQNPLWLGGYYAFDLTNPKVLEHLRKLFQKLVDDGFEYFKIDFLYHAAVKGRRHDMQCTRAQAVRQGLETIREAVGNSLILGCGAPLGSCIGITNAMRIGTDIAPAWRYEWGGGVYECAVNTMSRALMHNRLWLNDPDCVLVRQDDNDLTHEEVLLWLSVVALSGGVLMMSDRMEEVSEERLMLLDKVLPPYKKGAVALDAFTEADPSTFVLPIETPIGQWCIVGLVNLSEKAIKPVLRVKEMGFGEETPCHVFDFWSQVYEGLYEDIIDLGEIQPHTHRLLMIRPDEVHPSLLSTSIHFTQGAVEIGTLEWNSKAKTLEFTIIMDTRKDESIYVVFNGRWKPRSTFIDEMQVEFTRVTPEVIKVSHKFRRGQSVRIQFDSI